MASKFKSGLLKEVRRARRLSLTEVSEYTRISENSLRQFEDASKIPSVTQVDKLANLYNAPSFAFYGDKERKISDTLTDFRKTNPSTANVSPKGLVKIWSAERSGEFLGDVISALGRDAPGTKSLSRITNRNQPDAVQMRAAFDAWIEDTYRTLKISGTNEEKFIRQLRYFLEVHGCRTIVNSAPLEDYLGFYTEVGKSLNTIFVNRDIKNLKRQAFTLAHETAHFVYDAEGISDPFVAKNAIERQCNEFAAEFLAPEDTIFRIIHSLSEEILRDTSKLVSLISRDTLLSRQAAALRLRDLDVLSASQVNSFYKHLTSLRRVVEVEAPKPTKPMGRPAAIGKKLNEVGLYAAKAAAVALRKRIVGPVEIERGLGITLSIQQDVLDSAEKKFDASSA